MSGADQLKALFCRHLQTYELIFVVEQSGVFLDHCQAVTLPHLDFPKGEESARALWKRSEDFLEQFL